MTRYCVCMCKRSGLAQLRRIGIVGNGNSDTQSLLFSYAFQSSYHNSLQYNITDLIGRGVSVRFTTVMSLGLRTVMVDSSVLMLVHDDDAKMPTISQSTHTHHTDECINKQRRRRKHTTQTTTITLSPSSSSFFTPFLLSILLSILLLVVLFLPQPALAGGPRLLSSEYEIRTLKVGTIQYSPSAHLSNANAATRGEGADDSHEYELAWRRYQLLAIDLIFDQPLYISSVHAIADAKNGGSKKSNKNAKPSAPHSSSNDTSLPHLDGSIILDCVDEQHFVLSKWPTVNGDSGKNNMPSDDTFWSSPQPVLLPSYSPSNSLKDQLRDLFDPYSDMDHTGGVPKRRSQTLFGLDSHAMKDVLQVAGRPNVLSLMLVMQYEDGASGEMKTFLDWAKYYSNTQDMNITNPLGDLCRIRYESIHDRQAKLEMQLAHLNLLATEVMEDTKTDDGRVGSDDHPQQLRQRVEAKMEDMYGLTNFKGHVSTEQHYKLHCLVGVLFSIFLLTHFILLSFPLSHLSLLRKLFSQLPLSSFVAVSARRSCHRVHSFKSTRSWRRTLWKRNNNGATRRAVSSIIKSMTMMSVYMHTHHWMMNVNPHLTP